MKNFLSSLQFRIAWQFCSCLLFFRFASNCSCDSEQCSSLIWLRQCSLPHPSENKFSTSAFHSRSSQLVLNNSKNFQGCCLLFNYQGSVLLSFSRQLIYIITSCICLSTTFFIFLILCCPQCSQSSGCPDDECYNITAIWNCQ